MTDVSASPVSVVAAPPSSVGARGLFTLAVCFGGPADLLAVCRYIPAGGEVQGPP